MRTFTIPCQIYRFDINLICGDVEESLEYIAKEFKLDKDFLEEYICYTANGATICMEIGIILCWIREPFTTKYLVDTLHELDHACNFILRAVGIDHNRETEEAYSYLKTHAHECLFQIIEDEKKKVSEEKKISKTATKKKPVKKKTVTKKIGGKK